MYGVSPSKSRLIKLIRPTDVQSAAIWGTAALAGGIYLVQEPGGGGLNLRDDTDCSIRDDARRPGTAFLHAAPAPRDGWEPWPRLSGVHGFSSYTSSGSGWEHSSQGHGDTKRTWNHFTQGEGDSHMSIWGHSSQVHDAGGCSWGQSFQSHGAGTSTWGHTTQVQSPYVDTERDMSYVQSYTSAMGHNTQTDYVVPSAWAVGSSWGHSTQSGYGHVVQAFPQPTYGFPPKTFDMEDDDDEQDDDDEEPDPPIQLRQQPRRAVKGKGRLCHTSGRSCG
ncbi:hypothetical protein AgCh_006413 [Apium graveolens]